jgi:hypothetical protein
MSHIFEELKSDKTNRVMSPEKDIRFEEKYTSTLTSTEREAVIAQYGIVRSSHDKCYSEILQQFILKEFNKNESTDNIQLSF